jgi:hypothetical protein
MTGKRIITHFLLSAKLRNVPNSCWTYYKLGGIAFLALCICFVLQSAMKFEWMRTMMRACGHGTGAFPKIEWISRKIYLKKKLFQRAFLWVCWSLGGYAAELTRLMAYRCVQWTHQKRVKWKLIYYSEIKYKKRKAIFALSVLMKL